ncbi:MAG TPA: amidase [Shinella sp.]|jgi:amidase/aspartyl-tRNA(Asn)/glutamyl-tRNA(Gln) amidotransferase subunit A|uniref:amidase n=1 Tax=Shinella sp. TaxID=1870904 RepID=UPI002E11764F|nr:amidase [Shinella sp.]
MQTVSGTAPQAHPLDLPATDIAAGIRAGAFSAVSVVAESLRRAKIVDQSLNAFTLLREEAALASAREADRQVATGAETPALTGVPFAAKDLTPTRGDLTTLGSWTREAWVPTETALCIARLEAAGAILIGKTTTPEFAHSSFTASPRWGITRNPWNAERTCGGSSGGSAVAVATGVVPFAEGTDMGGSVRIPAAFCGIVGFKPSLGRIPMTILPSVFDNISHFGPLARTIEDAVAFMAVASGPDDADITSLPLAFAADKARHGRLAGRRFALSADLGYYSVDASVQASLLAAVDEMRAAGAVVETVDLGWSRAVNDGWYDLWCVFMSAFFGDTLEAYRERMDPLVVDLIERGRTMGATQYKRVELLRTAMWKDLSAILSGYDALLSPTCAMTAPSAEANDNSFVADLPDGRFQGLDMTCPFNLLPQCPALSVPIGLAGNGLPVGLQIIGRRYADEDVLSIGGAIEGTLRAIGRPEGWCW